ncbi:hypothetical protein ACNVED_02390 [Legionella sp. D16C41]|uniref:hypothetical protein n=1 Tax=Legionella sp. D16C41 TaxID=3402688 RepID=UPI003AF40B36
MSIIKSLGFRVECSMQRRSEKGENNNLQQPEDSRNIYTAYSNVSNFLTGFIDGQFHNDQLVAQAELDKLNQSILILQKWTNDGSPRSKIDEVIVALKKNIGYANLERELKLKEELVIMSTDGIKKNIRYDLSLNELNLLLSLFGNPKEGGKRGVGRYPTKKEFLEELDRLAIKKWGNDEEKANEISQLKSKLGNPEDPESDWASSKDSLDRAIYNLSENQENEKIYAFVLANKDKADEEIDILIGAKTRQAGIKTLRDRATEVQRYIDSIKSQEKELQTFKFPVRNATNLDNDLKLIQNRIKQEKDPQKLKVLKLSRDKLLQYKKKPATLEEGYVVLKKIKEQISTRQIFEDVQKKIEEEFTLKKQDFTALPDQNSFKFFENSEKSLTPAQRTKILENNNDEIKQLRALAAKKLANDIPLEKEIKAWIAVEEKIAQLEKENEALQPTRERMTVEDINENLISYLRDGAKEFLMRHHRKDKNTITKLTKHLENIKQTIEELRQEIDAAKEYKSASSSSNRPS